MKLRIAKIVRLVWPEAILRPLLKIAKGNRSLKGVTIFVKLSSGQSHGFFMQASIGPVINLYCVRPEKFEVTSYKRYKNPVFDRWDPATAMEQILFVAAHEIYHATDPYGYKGGEGRADTYGSKRIGVYRSSSEFWRKQK